jgi:hypothetical protein
MPHPHNSDSACSRTAPLDRSLLPAGSLAADTRAAGCNQASAGSALSPFRRTRNAAGRLSVLQIAICVAAIFVASATTA